MPEQPKDDVASMSLEAVLYDSQSGRFKETNRHESSAASSQSKPEFVKPEREPKQP